MFKKNLNKGNMVRIKNGYEEDCLGLVEEFNPKTSRYTVKMFGTVAKSKKKYYQKMYFTRFDLELLK